MFSFGVLSLMGSAMMGLFPLFCFTPTKDGGLGFDEKNIGNAISLRAVAILVVQMVAFPWLQRKMGTYRLYRLMMFLWIPAFLGLPVLNLFARAEHVGWVWSGLTLTIMCGAIGNMAFGKSLSGSADVSVQPTHGQRRCAEQAVTGVYQWWVSLRRR
jgi:hypothetical protein